MFLAHVRSCNSQIWKEVDVMYYQVIYMWRKKNVCRRFWKIYFLDINQAAHTQVIWKYFINCIVCASGNWHIFSVASYLPPRHMLISVVHSLRTGPHVTRLAHLARYILQVRMVELVKEKVSDSIDFYKHCKALKYGHL